MAQKHIQQHGIFHITTNTFRRTPWCIEDGFPEVLIDNLCMTRSYYQAHLHAFCILPDHMHIILRPGPLGFSTFMHSFKKNSSRDLYEIFQFEGAKWQKGYHDEIIRDLEQMYAAFHYVENNACKHDFVDNINDWPWTSLHFPHLIDKFTMK